MIVTLSQLESLHPRTTVLVTGGFDPLHYGHVRYLRRAAAVALSYQPWRYVVVGVAPDSYVSRKHPVLQALEHRLEMVDALRFVDFVASQEEETAASIIRAARPAVFVKGSDWKDRGLPRVEIEALEEVGAEVMYVPVNPVSSSDLLRDYFWRYSDEMVGRF